MKRKVVAFCVLLLAFCCFCGGRQMSYADEEPEHFWEHTCHEDSEEWWLIELDNQYVEEHPSGISAHADSLIVLQEDIDLSANSDFRIAIESSTRYIICLNGHDLTLRYCSITVGGELCICDCCEKSERGRLICKYDPEVESAIEYDMNYINATNAVSIQFSNIDLISEDDGQESMYDKVTYSAVVYGDCCEFGIYDSYVEFSQGSIYRDTAEHEIISNSTIECGMYSYSSSSSYGKIMCGKDTEVTDCTFFMKSGLGDLAFPYVLQMLESQLVISGTTFENCGECVAMIPFNNIQQEKHLIVEEGNKFINNVSDIFISVMQPELTCPCTIAVEPDDEREYSLYVVTLPSAGDEVQLFSNTDSGSFPKMKAVADMGKKGFIVDDGEYLLYKEHKITVEPTESNVSVETNYDARFPEETTPSYQWYNAYAIESPITDDQATGSFNFDFSSLSLMFESEYNSVNQVWEPDTSSQSLGPDMDFVATGYCKLNGLSAGDRIDVMSDTGFSELAGLNVWLVNCAADESSLMQGMQQITGDESSIGYSISSPGDYEIIVIDDIMKMMSGGMATPSAVPLRIVMQKADILDKIEGQTEASLDAEYTEGEDIFGRYICVVTWPNGYSTVSRYVKLIDDVALCFAVNGGLAIEPIRGEGSVTIPNPLPIPTRSGYEFVGWYTDPDCTINAEAGTIVTKDTVLFAKWNKTQPAPMPHGGYTTTEEPRQKYTIPVSNEKTVQFEATLEDGKAILAEITEKSLGGIFAESGEQEGKADVGMDITIDISKAEADIKEVVLTKNSLNTLIEVIENASNPAEYVCIKLPESEVSFDANALKAISEQAKGNDIKLVVEKISEQKIGSAQSKSLEKLDVISFLDVYVESNGVRIHDFDGGFATVSAKFANDTSKQERFYHVFYIDDYGKMTEMKSFFKAISSERKLFFETSHFSNFVIIYDDSYVGIYEEDEILAPERKLALDSNLLVLQKGKKITVKWGEVPGADGYKVYATYCGNKKYEKIATVYGKTSVKFTELAGQKLKLGKNFKVYVVAFKKENGKKVNIAKSLVAHIVGSKNKKNSNTKDILLKKNSFLLDVGKTAKISATTVLEDSTKKILSDKHAPEFRYVTSDASVADVSKNGKIKAIATGQCTIYVYSKNGFSKTVEVHVK